MAKFNSGDKIVGKHMLTLEIIEVLKYDYRVKILTYPNDSMTTFGQTMINRNYKLALISVLKRL